MIHCIEDIAFSESYCLSFRYKDSQGLAAKHEFYMCVEFVQGFCWGGGGVEKLFGVSLHLTNFVKANICITLFFIPFNMFAQYQLKKTKMAMKRWFYVVY